MTPDTFNRMDDEVKESMLFEKGEYLNYYKTNSHVVLCFRLETLHVEAHYPHDRDYIELIRAVPSFQLDEGIQAQRKSRLNEFR